MPSCPTSCSPFVTLNDGTTMPRFGFGTWKLPEDKCCTLIYEAIKSGVRHIDTALVYGNEKQVGDGITKALKEGICKREDLWITSKLWNTFHHKDKVQECLQRTLKDLQVEYLDLYLIHFPIALKYISPDKKFPPGWQYDDKMVLEKVSLQETWTAMEGLKTKGLVKSIGVSNYSAALLLDMLSYCTIKPSVVQVELHPFLTQNDFVEFCILNDMHVTAYSPFGAPSYEELGWVDKSDKGCMGSEIVQSVAKKVNKTPAQVLLRFALQRNEGSLSVIPKTSRVERISENMDVFDFTLAEEDMKALHAMNKNKRYNDPAYFCKEVFGCACPIYS